MKRRSIIFIDSAYTLKEARRKGLLDFFRARGASGYFDRVVSVHPVADLADGDPKPLLRFHRLEPGHLLVQGAAGRVGSSLVFPFRFLRNQLSLVRTLLRLGRADQNLKLIMAADPFYSALIGLLLARLLRRPFAIRIGGNADEIHEATGALIMPRLFPTIGIQRAVQRFVLKRADLVVGINPNNLQFGMKNGARKQTAVLPISSGIARLHLAGPHERAPPAALRKRLGVAENALLLLYVGRLLDLKHPEDAVKAIMACARKDAAVAGMVIGDGPEEGRLKSLVTEAAMGDRIGFPGLLNQEELSLLYRSSILISPSAGQMALLEAALGAAAIVTYDRDFQANFIRDGVNGLKVNYRDVPALIEETERLCQDEALRDRLGREARADALVEVDPARVAATERAIFERLLGSD